MKKFVMALLAAVLVLGLCTVAFADPGCVHKTGAADSTLVKFEEKATMCGDRGSIYWDCTVCGAKKVESKMGDVVEHNYVADAENSVAATCTTDGVAATKCTICGDKKSATVKATGHAYATVTEVAATCYEDGYKTEKCANCGDVKTTYTAAFNHKYEDGKSALKKDVVEKVAPTCYEDGKGTQYCYLCKQNIECVIPCTGHMFSDWCIDEEPTCEKDGFKSRDCLRCTDKVSSKPYQEIEVLPALGHKVNFAVTKAPTCTAEGVQKGGCERCYKTFEEVVPALGHDWSEWTVTETYKTRTCERKGCEAFEVELLTATPDQPVDPDKPTEDKPVEDNPSQGGSSSTGSGSDASIPATGDNTSNVPYIMMVAAVAGLVALVASKRKVNC